MQLVDRTFKVMEILKDNPDGTNIKTISEELDMAQSTVHRLLTSLRKNGYVKKDEDTNKFKLSSKVLSLAIGYLDNHSLIKISKPYLQSLSEEFNEVVYLSEFENDATICVDVIQSGEGIQFYVKVGSEMPLNCSSAPQAIVSLLDDSDVDRIISKKNYTKYTSKTLVTSDDIKAKLKDVKKKSYALCYDEFEYGVTGISAPIRNKDGMPIGAITMLWIGAEEVDIDGRVSKLKEATGKISKLLGWRQ